MAEQVLDLFAGPSGWEVALAALGYSALGVELDSTVCSTRSAAGHRTLQADVAALDPGDHWPVWGMVASPPCTAYSWGGKREGIADQQLVYTCARRLAEGHDLREHYQARCTSPTSLLVVEPLRWALPLRPAWLAFEQVPAVLGLWQLLARLLEHRGYGTWVGLLNAADYGVPQVRRRAFLLARRGAQVAPPEATHGQGAGEGTLFGAHAPWVTMADALGWADGLMGFPRGADRSPSVVLGGTAYRERDLHPVAGPAPAITEKARSMERWPYERPSTTVQGDPRVWAPGHKENSADPPGKYQQRRGDQAIRVTLAEAAVLQGFPEDYPWQGTRSQQFSQVGNAVPPPLARAVLEAVIP